MALPRIVTLREAVIGKSASEVKAICFSLPGVYYHGASQDDYPYIVLYRRGRSRRWGKNLGHIICDWLPKREPKEGI